MSQIFAYLLVIAIFSMGLITLRVAWYEVDDASDSRFAPCDAEEEDAESIDSEEA